MTEQQNQYPGYVVVKVDEAQQLANYLVTRPYQEVDPLVQILKNSPGLAGKYAEAVHLLLAGDFDASAELISSLSGKKAEKVEKAEKKAPSK